MNEPNRNKAAPIDIEKLSQLYAQGRLFAIYDQDALFYDVVLEDGQVVGCISPDEIVELQHLDGPNLLEAVTWRSGVSPVVAGSVAKRAVPMKSLLPVDAHEADLASAH